MSMLYFGREIRFSERLTSTQDLAKERAEQEGASAAGMVIMTSYQTAGRGRQGRTWHAAPGANLIMTAIGRPVSQAELWQVAFVAAVAAADAVAATAEEQSVRLRFPNDVLLNGKKACGILVETAAGPDVPPGAVMPLIGVGVNVRGRTDVLPPDVAVRATTIEAETGREHSVGLVGASLNRALTARWNEWRAGGSGFTATLDAWHTYHDPDARRAFLLDGTPAPCRVLSVSAEGVATIELPDDSRRTVSVAHILLAG